MIQLQFMRIACLISFILIANGLALVSELLPVRTLQHRNFEIDPLQAAANNLLMFARHGARKRPTEKQLKINNPIKLTTRSIKLWARPQAVDTTPNEDKTGQGKLNEDKPNENKPQETSTSTGNSETYGTEWTISVPKFKGDDMGNWVYNPWGVTFGKIWEDTRFQQGGRWTIPRMRIDSELAKRYYPYDFPQSTVCQGRSTIYDKGWNTQWLFPHNYRYVQPARKIMKDLRKELYHEGDSEQCHTKNFTDWQEYQECAAKRNQRLEFLIPNYPQKQVRPDWD